MNKKTAKSNMKDKNDLYHSIKNIETNSLLVTFIWTINFIIFRDLIRNNKPILVAFNPPINYLFSFIDENEITLLLILNWILSIAFESSDFQQVNFHSSEIHLCSFPRVLFHSNKKICHFRQFKCISIYYLLNDSFFYLFNQNIFLNSKSNSFLKTCTCCKYFKIVFYTNTWI